MFGSLESDVRVGIFFQCIDKCAPPPWLQRPLRCVPWYLGCVARRAHLSLVLPGQHGVQMH